jgi:hypothetical protein
MSHRRQASKFDSTFHLLDVVAALREDRDYSFAMNTSSSVSNKAFSLAEVPVFNRHMICDVLFLGNQ